MIITHPIRPSINLLNSETIRSVLAEAKDILHELGFFVENREAVQLLEAEGATLNPEKGRIYIPHELAEKALDSAPSFIALFNREGTEAIELGGDSVCFDPGSAALSVLDPETGKIRAAVTRDFVDFSKVVDQLEHIHAQSTAIICSDVPVAISDRYRLYISLLYSNKPIVTGTFSKESFAVMKDMLIAVRGSGEALRKKPLAIFDACPSPRLNGAT